MLLSGQLAGAAAAGGRMTQEREATSGCSIPST
jgi:hypothetical protein